jgi:hypothetical protein
LKGGHLLDTDKATRMVVLPTRNGRGQGSAGARWEPAELGLKGRPRALADVAVWRSEDGTWFATANPCTMRLVNDGTDYKVYRNWDDPQRSVADLMECCYVLTPRRARNLCSQFMGPDEYQRAFPEETYARRGQMTLDTAMAAVMPTMPTAARRAR